MDQKVWARAQGYSDFDPGTFTWKNAAGERVSHNEVINGYNIYAKQNTNFTASHFDDPNVLAHFRTTDRLTPEGKKVFFIEETQSDWQKALRKMDKGSEDVRQGWDYEASKILHDKGFGENAPFSADDLKTIEETGRNPNRISGPPTSPDAPLARNYPELVMKRILRKASDEGYDAVGWTTGEQQAQRYNRLLRDNVDQITYDPQDQKLELFKNGNRIHSQLRSPLGLPQIVGKDIARRLLNGIETTSEEVPFSYYEHARGKAGAQLVPVLTRDGSQRFVWANPNNKKYLQVDRDLQPIFHPSEAEAMANPPRRDYFIDINSRPIPGMNPSVKITKPIGSISGDNLLSNSSGYSSLYDTQMRQIADKIGGKFGARTGQGQIKTGDSFSNVHLFPLTPSLRQHAQTRGFPLFQVAAPMAGLSAAKMYMNQSQGDQK